MKLLLNIAALLMMPGLVLSADPPSAYPPEAGFSTLSELNDWAGAHEWTGGRGERIELGGAELFYSMRSFTSGLPTTELIFYSRMGKDARIMPILIVPTQPKEMRVVVALAGVALRVESYSREAQKWIEMMTISKAMIPYHPPSHNSEQGADDQLPARPESKIE